MRHETRVKVGKDLLVIVERQVSETGMHKQIHQVHNIVAFVAQRHESLHSLCFELFVVHGVNTTHDLNHRGRDADLRGNIALKRWFFAEQETKVDVVEMSVLSDHQILEMPVTDTEQVSGDGVASDRVNVDIELLGELFLILAARLAEVIFDGLRRILLLDVCNGHGLWNELQEAIIIRAGDQRIVAEV